jgi:hypothetical protein
MHFWGNVKPDFISSAMINAYKDERIKEAGRKIHRAINLEIYCLSAMTKWAHEQGYCGTGKLPITPLPYKHILRNCCVFQDVHCVWLMYLIRKLYKVMLS